MIESYVCRHCGAPASPETAATTSACANCSKNWQPVTRGAARVDLVGMRERLVEALQVWADPDVVARVANVDVPMIFALLGEAAIALAALNGTCSCQPLKVKRRVGPCPHFRANLALRRMGVEPDDLARIRTQVDRTVA
jgi:hypothetical protein